MTSIYNGQFSGNILVVGRTGCGKTTFLEKLGLNKFFGDIIKTEWISGIDIDKKREAEIQSYFRNETEVHVAKEQDELDSLIETFKLRSQDDVTDNNDNNVNSFGKNKKMDRLIIMDDVSGVADVSKKFANFLIVSRKFGYNCVYVFHVIVLQVKFSKKLFFKRTFLIFFLLVCCIILSQKSFKITAFHKARSMFLHVRFGLIEFLPI